MKLPCLLLLPCLLFLTLAALASTDHEANPSTVSPSFSAPSAADAGVTMGLSDPDLAATAGTPVPSFPAQAGAGVKLSALDERAMKLTRDGLLLIPIDVMFMKVFPHIAPGQPKDILTSTANDFGTAQVLLPVIGGFYLFGDRRDKETAEMAGAALFNATLMTTGLKMLAGRARPNVTGEAGEFEGIEPDKGHGFSSFPSGHTSAAFSVATVLASRHPKHKWLYYGLATAVGLARMRSFAHFPSDVLVGAGIGTYAGRQALSHHLGLFSLNIKF